MLADNVKGGEEETDQKNIPMAPQCHRWRSAAVSASCAVDAVTPIDNTEEWWGEQGGRPGKAVAATTTTSPRPWLMWMPWIPVTVQFTKGDKMVVAQASIMTHTAFVWCC